jgi:hypothetical protein
MDAAKVESYYIELIFPLIGNLYAEALIIGVFVVGFGMLRRSLKSPVFFKEHSFYQRALLLLVIMVWTANLHASYGLYGREFDHTANPLNGMEAQVLATLTRVMIPLEIAATIITALMFGAIAFRDYTIRGTATASAPGKTAVRNMKREISLLFWLASSSHVLFMLWFIIVYGLTGRIGSIGSLFHVFGSGTGWDASPAAQPVALNVAFHFTVSVLYLLASISWRLSAQGPAYDSRYRLWDWVGVFVFCFIMINVYWFRLGQYISNMGASTTS